MKIHIFTKRSRNYNKPIIEKKFHNSKLMTSCDVFEKYVTEQK